LIKLHAYILSEKYIHTLALEMASTANWKCANCIASEATATWRFTNFVLYCIVSAHLRSPLYHTWVMLTLVTPEWLHNYRTEGLRVIMIHEMH